MIGVQERRADEDLASAGPSSAAAAGRRPAATTRMIFRFRLWLARALS